MTEEELALRAKQGDQAAFEQIIKAYTPLVRSRVHGYFLLGAETEDAMQEGMIGLFRAIRDYDPERGSLRAFADLCVRRQMLDAVKGASRGKHAPLNSAVSIEEQAPRLPPAPQGDPEQALLNRELYQTLIDQLKPALSRMETQVLELFLAGERYTEIALRLGKPPKSIDNALQRIRAKCRELD
ncbi:MAG: sigma-70 family RNA polymerase sigma factor [Clostridia bacterium]|nr:sigma-70 family RNA polymerase sigma factor [Clostridia bacterium]